MKLYIGDIGDYLARYAREQNPNSELLTAKNINFNNLPVNAYSSPGDLETVDLLRSVLDSYDNIHLVEPLKWSSSQSRDYLHRYLRFIAQDKNVIGLPDHYLPLNVPKRQRESKQMWVAGCSIAHGIGVNKSETFGHIIQKKLQIPLTDLSCPGSSIQWSSDQICRANIRSGDVVFWGITGFIRKTVISNNNVKHVVARHLTTDFITVDEKKWLLEYLDSDTNIYDAVTSIYRAYQYCRSIGADIIMLGVSADLDSYYQYIKLPVFKQVIFDEFLDYGNDQLHPGPKQHYQYAEKFLEMYNKNP